MEQDNVNVNLDMKEICVKTVIKTITELNLVIVILVTLHVKMDVLDQMKVIVLETNVLLVMNLWMGLVVKVVFVLFLFKFTKKLTFVMPSTMLLVKKTTTV